MNSDFLIDWTWLLCAYGICFYLMNKAPWLHGRSEVSDKLLNCSFCIGFHAGWITWLFYKLGVDSSFPFSLSQLLLGVCYGFKSAAFCYVIDSLAQLSESWIRSGPEEEIEEDESSDEDSWEKEMK
jgi:hypothetical protein